MEPREPTESAGEASVLIVDDEPGIADLYSAWLNASYDIHIAYGGEEAIAALSQAIDVVLLDRRMYDVTGDEVLEEINRRELDCGVAMVTAVEPDFDVIEMGFDDYLTKPVSQDELLDVVESLLAIRRYDDSVSELYRLYSKRSALEVQKSPEELEVNQEYQGLLADIERVEALADSAAGLAADRNPESLFRGLSPEASRGASR